MAEAALPCARTPLRAHGSVSTNFDDVEKSRNLNEDRHPVWAARFLPCATAPRARSERRRIAENTAARSSSPGNRPARAGPWLAHDRSRRGSEPISSRNTTDLGERGRRGGTMPHNAAMDHDMSPTARGPAGGEPVEALDLPEGERRAGHRTRPAPPEEDAPADGDAGAGTEGTICAAGTAGAAGALGCWSAVTGASCQAAPSRARAPPWRRRPVRVRLPQPRPKRRCAAWRDTPRAAPITVHESPASFAAATASWSSRSASASLFRAAIILRNPAASRAGARAGSSELSPRLSSARVLMLIFLTSDTRRTSGAGGRRG